jgi:outer membrane protein assembly factor BamD (BamD/ComL family)
MFYFRLKAYDSAILYLKDVVATYPKAAIVPEALVKLVQAYKALGYREDVQETCGYIHRFHPRAPQVGEVCPSKPAA